MKYVRIRPRADWDSWIEDYQSPHMATTVHEGDKQTFSGLYDSDGTPLYRDETRPIGFLHEY